MKNLSNKIDWLIGNLEDIKLNVIDCRTQHKKMQLNTIFLNAAICHFTDILKESHCLECSNNQLRHDLPSLSYLKNILK